MMQPPLAIPCGAVSVGVDPEITFCHPANREMPQLSISVGGDELLTEALRRRRDPVADVTYYAGHAMLGRLAVVMELTVNCGAPQPYCEIRYGKDRVVTVFITHHQQDQILAVADPISSPDML